MAKTVIGLFERMGDAQGAVSDLDNAGVSSDAVTLMRQPDANVGSRLQSVGIPDQDAGIYAQGVQQGEGLVVVQGVADDDAEQVADIIDRHHPVEINRRKQSGGQRMSLDRSASATRTSPANTSLYQGDEIAVPIIEEELRIGKRQVERGGVRIRTRVEERPVEQQVTLRDEHVEVQRRPVNRSVTDADVAQLQSGPIEVRETDEQAVVAKEARVVEEVVVRKQAEEHVETVRDTVRRTDVDVEQVSGQMGTSGTTTGSTMDTAGTAGSGRGTAGEEGMIERGG